MGKIVTGRGISQGISDIMNFTDLHNYDVWASDLKKFAEKALEAARTQPNGLQPSAEIQESIWDSFCEKMGIDQYDIDEDETLYQIVCDFVEVVTKDFEKQNESVQKENSMNLLEAKKVMRDAGYKLMKEEWTYTPEIEDKLVAAGAATRDVNVGDDNASWNDDGFADNFRKTAKFLKCIDLEEIIAKVKKITKGTLKRTEIETFIQEQAEDWAKTYKNPCKEAERFTDSIFEYYRKYARKYC